VKAVGGGPVANWLQEPTVLISITRLFQITMLNFNTIGVTLISVVKISFNIMLYI
jgi:hypothetical protein